VPSLRPFVSTRRTTRRENEVERVRVRERVAAPIRAQDRYSFEGRRFAAVRDEIRVVFRVFLQCERC
jgi:hypothetical protein